MNNFRTKFRHLILFRHKVARLNKYTKVHSTGKQGDRLVCTKMVESRRYARARAVMMTRPLWCLVLTTIMVVDGFVPSFAPSSSSSFSFRRRASSSSSSSSSGEERWRSFEVKDGELPSSVRDDFPILHKPDLVYLVTHLLTHTGSSCNDINKIHKGVTGSKADSYFSLSLFHSLQQRYVLRR